MKLVKSLLLGSAAGLSAVAGAQAADLPVQKAAPVEYVRVCSAYGAGFFFIPGTDTCLRVGGRVRAEYLFAETFDRRQDNGGFNTVALNAAGAPTTAVPNFGTGGPGTLVNGVFFPAARLNVAGETAPDGVANIRVDQAFGSAQVSAAVHQVRSA